MECEKIFLNRMFFMVFNTCIIAIGKYFCNYTANFLFGLRPYNAVRTAGTSC